MCEGECGCVGGVCEGECGCVRGSVCVMGSVGV